jgi:hypothetical protein
MADHADLEIYQGDDFTAVVTIRNQDGTVADITGYTAKAQIRRQIADEDPLVVAEIATSVTSPQVSLSLTHTQTTLLQGRYKWDLQLTTPTGEIDTVLAGTVITTAEITR